jgi:hypothetical protein
MLCNADGQCALACAGGRENCDGSCVDTTNDPRHCGACDRPCDRGDVCEASRCAAGPDCGDPRTPCTGFTYCDLATGTCLPGCLEDDSCGENERCERSSHTCVCNDGYHRCSGACVSNSAPSSCGTRCTPCPTAANGHATCRSGVCGIACDTGHHQCGPQCVADTSVEHCGTRCSPCPTAPNGTPTCERGVCGLECSGGTTNCPATGTCEACCDDVDCATGQICERDAPGVARTCRRGCHRHGQCAESEYCTDALTCADLSSAGLCRGVPDCRSGQYCDVQTMQCREPPASWRRCSTAENCCRFGESEQNRICVPHPAGSRCVGYLSCGYGQFCTSITQTCYGVTACRNIRDECAPGLWCDSSDNPNWPQWWCRSSWGEECSTTDTRMCKGMPCHEGTCRMDIPCDSWDDCNPREDSVHVCVSGTCRYATLQRCQSDADCYGDFAPRDARSPDGDPREFHCVTAAGYCRAGAAPGR